jgi:hypothetical protein
VVEIYPFDAMDIFVIFGLPLGQLEQRVRLKTGNFLST